MTNRSDKAEKANSKVVPILGTVLAVLAVVMVVVLCLPRKNRQEVPFTPPPFEESAVSGVPTVPETLGYSSPYKDGMSYRFSICGNVQIEDDRAVVFLTNPAENKVLVKVRILDASGTTLGESGLLKPGEYVRTVRLTSIPAAGTKIKLKIMGYEPDTYLSAGSVTLNTAIADVITGSDK